jgi:hypothetical protein
MCGSMVLSLSVSSVIVVGSNIVFCLVRHMLIVALMWFHINMYVLNHSNNAKQYLVFNICCFIENYDASTWDVT